MNKAVQRIYGLGYNTFLATAEQFGSKAVIIWIMDIQMNSMPPERCLDYGSLLNAMDQGTLYQRIGALQEIVNFPGPNTLLEVINIINDDWSLAMQILACQTLQKLVDEAWKRGNLLEIGIIVFAAEGLLAAVKQKDFPTLQKEAQKAIDCIREGGHVEESL